MKTHLKTVKASIIIGILFISIIPIIITTKPATAARLISFHSYMDLTYDPTILNKPLQIDVAVAVPVQVQFWTDIPDIFSKGWPFNFLFLFGSSIVPMQQIHLELLETPDWANIYFSSPDLIVDIPFESEGKKIINATLIISPKIEAPAESQRISIKATINSLKRLGGFTFQKEIPFTPSFIPTIGIEIENPIRTVGPHQSVSFNIVVKNMGNKITRVTPTLIGVDSRWTPTINPPNYEIYPKQQSTFSFALITPYDFGWHNEYGRFEVSFNAEVYPYITDSASSNESIYLVVNNNGFSTPGFELVGVIAAFIIVMAIIQKRRLKNE